MGKNSVRSNRCDAPKLSRMSYGVGLPHPAGHSDCPRRPLAPFSSFFSAGLNRNRNENMMSSSPTSRSFRARAFLWVIVAGLTAALAGCGPASEAKSPSSTASTKTKSTERGFTLQSDGLRIDATKSAALLPSHSSQALSLRIMGGWVDQARIKRANQETDPAKKKQLAMGSFGTIALQIGAGKPEPGTYQLVPEGKDPQTGTIVIGQAKSAGLADEYTSKSGTLTVRSVTMDGKKLLTIDGAFEGQFDSEEGDSRTFSGQFQFFPNEK